MNSSALTLMIIVFTTVFSFTTYFFFKVLKSPPKPEPDSYVDNDPE